MADIDVLPQRGVPALALVDSTGIATNGSQTVAQLASRGMRAVCAVDATGVSVSGATVAQLASVGIRAFCPVDENGVSQAGPNADALRRAGIRPMVLLGNTGIALTGSATMLTLAQRGLQYFCPIDEAGNATTMGAVILITNTTIFDIAAIGTNVGVLSVVGGTGTYTFTLTNNAGGRFAVAGTNGVNLNTASAVTVGTYAVTVSATNGGTPITRTINISVILYVVPRLTASVGIFAYNGEDMIPMSGWVFPVGAGAFALVDPGTTKLTPPVAAYTGPGDLTGWGTAYAYYGMRAYTAAKATALTAAIRITDQAGAHATDIHVTATGGINLAEIAAFKTSFSPTRINIIKIYDQSPNGRHLDTVVGGAPPFLTENTIATSLPAINFDSATVGTGVITVAAAATTQSQPITVAGITKFTGTGQIFTDGGFGFQACVSLFGGNTGRSQQAGGSRIDYFGADSTWESIQSVMAGASSSMRINNTKATNGDPGSVGIAQGTLAMGGTAGGGSLLTGFVFELIVKAGAVSDTDQTALYNNAHTAGLV